MHHVVQMVSTKARRGHQNPLELVTDGCGLPSRCWKSNPGLLQGQHVLLSAELFSSPSTVFLLDQEVL